LLDFSSVSRFLLNFTFLDVIHPLVQILFD
jgi:hypothetical protein